MWLYPLHLVNTWDYRWWNKFEHFTVTIDNEQIGFAMRQISHIVILQIRKYVSRYIKYVFCVNIQSLSIIAYKL